MWNFEENLLAKGIILRYTSKPERGLFILQSLINFFISNMLGEKELKNKNKRWARMRMT